MVAETIVEDGVRAMRRELGEFVVDHVVYRPGHVFPRFEPETPYFVIVLAGGIEKQFADSADAFTASSILTIPAGATHSTRFRPATTRILKITPRSPAGRLLDAFPGAVLERRHDRSRVCAELGWRLAAEVAARDSAATLAAEGLVLEFLAVVGRTAVTPSGVRRPAWLATVEELLHADCERKPTLAELAAAVNVHPAHLARAFRRHHGLTVGGYLRRLRLERATATLVATDVPLATVAADAGFADQSHFTRAFKQHTGITPGRYRLLVRDS